MVILLLLKPYAIVFGGDSLLMMSGSPERMEGFDYTYSADIWSLGLVVYELASGVPL
jgi:hypothetical protein